MHHERKTKTVSTIDERLDALESRSAIRNLVSEYAHAFDRRDRDLLKGLWHDDATFSLGEIGGPFHGPDGILEGAEGLWAVNPVMHHWTANVVIHIDADRANGRCAVDVMVANVEDGPTQVGGSYEDTFERRDGVWKFVTREFTVDYWTPLNEWRPTLGTEMDTIADTI